jgi:lysyl-tRNA synthetase class 2
MSKRRDEYLQKHWQKYPESPRGALKYGRVHQLRLGVQNLSDSKVLDDPDFNGSDILKDGDLVAILPQAKFILLAPNLTERTGFYNIENDPWVKNKNWFEFIALVRLFFKEKRFLDVKTKTLVTCPGTEPSLDAFETEFAIGSKTQKFYLPTSPELNLKKLLSMGADRIFEIATVFRNGEQTNRHNPEFLMLEWYRAYAHLSQIKHDVIELVEFVCDQLKVERPKEVLTFTIPELFKKYCQFDLKPETTIEEFRVLAQKMNIDVQSATCIDDYFFLIFIEKIEFQWPMDRLVFVEKYPPYQAALARVGRDGWAERFEVYWQGLELANAFHELNDPLLQRQRSNEDLQKKVLMNKPVVELDEEFFQALEYGMPPSSGIALGLERLFMAMKKITDINQVL